MPRRRRRADEVRGKFYGVAFGPEAAREAAGVKLLEDSKKFFAAWTLLLKGVRGRGRI